MRILICTDGSPSAEQAAPVGVELARAAGAQVTVLGVASAASGETAVRAAMDRLQARLPAPAEAVLRRGRPALEYLAEAESGRHDLMIVGSRGRRGWVRMAFGSVAARLARFAPIPVLIVKGRPRPGLRRILACTGGGAPGERVARWAGQVGGWMGADVTVLHVMSQIAVSPRAQLDELTESAEEAVARQTREGLHLARERELLTASGGPEPRAVQLELRHGLVLEEIVDDAKQGDYDLVVLGGHQPPEFAAQSHLKAYLIEDMTDQVLMAIDRPILIIKGP